MPEMAADLLAFVDALVLDRFHLVGHSLGAPWRCSLLEHGQRLVGPPSPSLG
jgi:pimeloyl-ACP methyl ester carboxylesterase